MKLVNASCLCLALLILPGLVAEDAPQVTAPQKEHAWLKQFVGEWESKSEAEMAPGQEPIHCSGTMSARMLGGFWMVSETKFNMLEGEMQAIQTIGYDVEKKKYVGTWIDSMFNHMWKYEGSVDDAGKILTLEAEGPSFLEAGKLVKFRDVYEFKSKDEIASSSQIQKDGKWITFMKGTAKRKAK